MIEALTGLLFLGVFWKFDLEWETIKYLIFTSYLIVVTFIDFDHMVIVDSTNIVAVVLGLPFLVIGDLRGNFVESILGILLGAGIIAIIRFISRGGMGDGDIFLMGVVGFYLGYKMLPLQFMLTLVFASVISILLIVFKIKSRKDYIPFGPFIAIGAWVTLIWGNDILNWYTKLLF
jgi:leader peptidase (prepilin peptidase)/N-methyltransferase